MSDRTPVEPHDAWTATGHCPEIHSSKAWCNGKRDHRGNHWAPRLLVGETEPSKAAGIFWTTDARPTQETDPE